jgi:hypothetical protein
MMAVGLVEILKALEGRFGADGHDLARDTLRRVGTESPRR